MAIVTDPLIFIGQVVSEKILVIGSQTTKKEPEDAYIKSTAFESDGLGAPNGQKRKPMYYANR